MSAQGVAPGPNQQFIGSGKIPWYICKTQLIVVDLQIETLIITRLRDETDLLILFMLTVFVAQYF